MANGLSSFTDDQLLKARQGDFSSLSNDQLLSLRQASGQQRQGLSFSGRDLSVPREQKSPLNLLERMKLSFADDAGRENFLRNKFGIVQRLPNGKFAAGNNPNEVAPIDPEGIFNDVLGDLSDIVSEIPVIAGQIGGAILGAPAGPGGIIGGGAVGAATGETARIGLGRAFGVRKSTAFEEATDIAIVGAFGAAGEALIPASRFIGSTLKSKLVNQIAKSASKASAKTGVPIQDTFVARATAKTFNILSNVPEESTFKAFEHGIEKTLGSPRNLNANTVLELADNLKATLTTARRVKGKAVEAATDRLISKNAQKTNIEPLYQRLRSDLQEINLIDEAGDLVRTNTSKENLTFARRILSRASGSKSKVLSNFPEKLSSDAAEFSIKDLIRFRRELGDSVNSNLTPQMKRIVTRFVNGDETIPGIRTIVDDIAQRSGSQDYILANQEFSELMAILDELNFIKKDDVVSLERFIKGQENLPLTRVRSLRALDANLPPEQKFLKEIEMWNAAQDFKSARPDILRFGFLAATLGSIFGFEDQPSRLQTLGGAILLGTPAGQRQLLRGVAGVGRLTGSAASTIPRTLKGEDRIKQRQLLNALISTAGRQGAEQRQ